MSDIMKFAVILIMVLQCVLAAAQQEGTGVRPYMWHVRGDAGVEQEHVAFLSRGVRLSGTLFYQSDQRQGPAIVVLHGASSPLQDLPLYEHLKQMLPPLGVAVFPHSTRSNKCG